MSSLIGGAILNLVNFVVKGQSQFPVAERRKVTVVVDEMQTFRGVPFEEMISRVAKIRRIAPYGHAEPGSPQRDDREWEDDRDDSCECKESDHFPGSTRPMPN